MSKSKEMPLLKKINIVRGQLEGVAKMMENDRDCLEVLIQLKAAKSGINHLASSYAQEYLSKCLSGKRKLSAKELESIFKETI